MKSLINQLHASRHPNGARSFKNAFGVCFGWRVIERHYDREVERMKQNLPKLVKKLQKSYIERDSWTKLNVLPAKILQVCNQISFLL